MLASVLAVARIQPYLPHFSQGGLICGHGSLLTAKSGAGALLRAMTGGVRSQLHASAVWVVEGPSTGAPPPCHRVLIPKDSLRMQDKGHPPACIRIPYIFETPSLGECLLRLALAFPPGKRREHPKSAGCAMILAACRVERPSESDRVMLLNAPVAAVEAECVFLSPSCSRLRLSPWFGVHPVGAGLMFGSVIDCRPRLIECPGVGELCVETHRAGAAGQH